MPRAQRRANHPADEPVDVEDRVEGLKAGADDCLTKPFKFGELTARIQSVLRRHRITLLK